MVPQPCMPRVKVDDGVQPRLTRNRTLRRRPKNSSHGLNQSPQSLVRLAAVRRQETPKHARRLEESSDTPVFAVVKRGQAMSSLVEKQSRVVETALGRLRRRRDLPATTDRESNLIRKPGDRVGATVVAGDRRQINKSRKASSPSLNHLTEAPQAPFRPPHSFRPGRPGVLHLLYSITTRNCFVR
ncbi:hypothetical protein DAEQUDRAFT_50923 [Daedalea quercina L-15889]|uniref:Uncharacterized protein n=1 Tax=Daedalea quercina L-15889 TaxID=1314783 RepID=A0A165LA51_9APHY|nr:hypothetical protein DAEQUDRAFT_50923 [Daedalea quercina L-15889]